MNAHKYRILLIEDEQSLAKILLLQLRALGFECEGASSLAEADAALNEHIYDLLLLDIGLPDGNGIDYLDNLRNRDGLQMPVIIITGDANVDNAVRAMKVGATDFIPKPETADEILIAVEKALVHADSSKKLFYAQQRRISSTKKIDWIGESPQSHKLIEDAGRLANVFDIGLDGIPVVMITGETGTGKNLMAKTIHSLSPRAHKPFVQIDCGSLPENLMEGELFGHVKGAYTQASESRIGLLESSEDGVLFLDEVGELPLHLQTKLLAALDRRMIRRLGSNREVAIRSSIIVATNCNLPDLVAAGKFRQDLFYRINGLSMHIPPIRERQLDVLPICQFLLAGSCKQFRRPNLAFSSDALQALSDYSWPGNVREMKHVIHRAVLLAQSETLTAADLAISNAAVPNTQHSGSHQLDNMTLEQAERHLVEAALLNCDNNISESARILGISRGALRNRLEKFGL
ncbi:MAG: sigma-54-dependent Fis family transcriptional regulator [Planctomycetes bacterium]|nr:sigma-54-dependent Fis family transcriptional regulator [Planctomycetota bacterium]